MNDRFKTYRVDPIPEVMAEAAAAPNQVIVKTTLDGKATVLAGPQETPISDRINAVCKKLRREAPATLMQEHFPKRFRVPATHYDPRIYGYSELFSSASTPDGDRLNESLRDIVGECHETLDRTNYPTYFLDPQTLDMLTKSGLSDSIHLSNLSMPLPSMVVALPKGAIKTSPKREIAVLVICKNLYWVYDDGTHDDQPEHLEHGSGMIEDGMIHAPWDEVQETLTPDKRNHMQCGLSIVAVDNWGHLLAVPLWANDDRSLKEGLEAMTLREREDFEHEDDLLVEGSAKAAVEIAVKLLAFLAAKPNETTKHRTPIREARWRRGVLKKEALWGPNFIGRNYGDSLTARGYGGSGRKGGRKDGRKQRYHWRRGHIKSQRYGKGRRKVKTIVIDPYPVNRPDDDDAI